MTLEQRLLRPFTKAKYLSEENYKRYTAIIHYLYQQHEVYYAPPSLPSSILEFIKEHDLLGFFSEYDLAKLEADLTMLETWGNVISHQDSGNVSRIEDFNRRKLRYQCTPETIEIERLLEKMNSQINRVKGSLDSNLVNSLSSIMIELETFKAKAFFSKDDKKELSQLWNQLFSQFENLRKESSDYLGIIHSRNIDDAMQNKEISAFRLKFTEYLTGFIITLQKNVHIIEFSIGEIEKELIHRVINALILEQKDKPSLGEPITDEEYREIYLNQWNALKNWFKYDEYNERFVDYLLKQTNETISRFTKYLQQISERDQQIKSRKKDFEHIARLFKKELDMELCQKSFGAMTNIERPLHFISQSNRKIDSDKSLYDHEPEVIFIKSAKETAARTEKKRATVEPTLEDLMEIERLRKQREYEDREIQNLVERGRVKISELENVQPFMRKALLQWISYCNGREKMKGKTDQGIPYSLQKESNETIQLKCTDGILTMPDYVFQFGVQK
jgi:uncharacterized protein (TIGR02677 family)